MSDLRDEPVTTRACSSGDVSTVWIVPRTNLDRIHIMQVPELALFLAQCGACPPPPFTDDKCKEHNSCEKCWSEWLQMQTKS